MVPEYSNDDGPGLRVGVIGASGWASHAHLPALAGAPGLQLAAIATSREESARSVAARWDVPHWFTSACELAASDSVDLVAISVKAPLHRQLIEQVLEAGKPILCEWPFGVSTAQSRELVDLISRSGAAGFVGLQAMVNPVLQEVGRRIRQGVIGTVMTATMRASRASKDPVPAESAYTLQDNNGAGMLDILGGHALSALQTAAGIERLAPSTVHGTSSLLQPEHRGDDGGTIHATSPDAAAGIMALDHGIASLTLTDGVMDPGTELTIIGTAGRVRAWTLNTDRLRLRQPQMADWSAEITTGTGIDHLQPPQSALPLAARNPALLYQMIRHDLAHETRHAPTSHDAVAIHQALDRFRGPRD